MKSDGSGKGPDRIFEMAGIDPGPSTAGFVNNFHMGPIEVAAGAQGTGDGRVNLDELLCLLAGFCEFIRLPAR